MFNFVFFCSSTDYRNKYLTNKAGSNSSLPAVTRSSQGRHLGSHQRGGNKANSSRTGHGRFGNATLQTPARPAPMYETPVPFSTAVKCSDDICRLPDCFCGGTEIPGKEEKQEKFTI